MAANQLGHGGVSGRHAQWEEVAFELAWVLDVLGFSWPWPWPWHWLDNTRENNNQARNREDSGPVSGAPSGTRTPNPLIKSQLLCQLS